MYEICRLLASNNPKTRKVSTKPRAKPVRVGMTVEVGGRQVVVTRRDTKYPNAWYCADNGVEHPLSFSRSMIFVK